MDKEASIHGIYIAKGTFPLALRLLSAHQELFGKIVSHRIPIEDWDRAQGPADVRSGAGQDPRHDAQAMTAVSQDVRAVLLPISHSLTVEPWLQDFLRAGGRSVLLASSPEEYAARRISDARRAAESAEAIRSLHHRRHRRVARASPRGG